jgi:hypothetical protein
MAPPPEVVVISDDEEEAPMLEEEELMLMEEDPMIVEDITGHEDDDDWITEPAPAPLVSPLSALPAPAPAPASLPVPAPSPIAPSVEGVQEMVPAEEEPGWTRMYIYKHAPATAYHHNLLRNMFLDYYPNMHASIQYYCAEYTHPTEVTYWKTELTVTTWKDSKNGRVVDTIHGHTSKHADAFDSMEDAALEAYQYYHGLRYEAMGADRFRYLPHHDPPEGSWVITNPEDSYPTLDATVRHAHALKIENGDLKRELRDLYKTWRRFQKEIDDLRAQLGKPLLYKKLDKDYDIHDVNP